MIISPTDLVSAVSFLNEHDLNDERILVLSSTGFSSEDSSSITMSSKEVKNACIAMNLLLNHVELSEDGSIGYQLAEKVIAAHPALFVRVPHKKGFGLQKKIKSRIECHIRYIQPCIAEDIVKANAASLKPATLKVSKRKIKLIFPENEVGRVKFGYLVRGMKSKKSSASLPPLPASPERSNNAFELPVPLARHSSTDEVKGTVKNSQARRDALSNEYIMPDDDGSGHFQEDTEIDTPSAVLVAQDETLYQNQGQRQRQRQRQSQSQSSIYGPKDGMNQYLEDAQREDHQDVPRSQAAAQAPQQTAQQAAPQPAPRSHRLIETQSLSGQALRLMREGNIPYIPGDIVSMQRLEIILQSLSMNDAREYPDASQANDDSDDEYTCI